LSALFQTWCQLFFSFCLSTNHCATSKMLIFNFVNESCNCNYVQATLVICGIFICEFAYMRLKNDLFSGTYALIYSDCWSFYMQIHYMRAYFWSPYLSHIKRSTCTCNIFFQEILQRLQSLRENMKDAFAGYNITSVKANVKTIFETIFFLNLENPRKSANVHCFAFFIFAFSV
jgi:hypothetical protein